MRGLRGGPTPLAIFSLGRDIKNEEKVRVLGVYSDSALLAHKDGKSGDETFVAGPRQSWVGGLNASGGGRRSRTRVLPEGNLGLGQRLFCVTLANSGSVARKCQRRFKRGRRLGRFPDCSQTTHRVFAYSSMDIRQTPTKHGPLTHVGHRGMAGERAIHAQLPVLSMGASHHGLDACGQS